MSLLPLRIVKIGCSLFERRQLPEQLRRWLAGQPPAINVLLAGAGELAESIHNWDSRFELNEESSHWLCIDALSITAQVLHLSLRGIPLVTTFAELQQFIAAGKFSGVPNGLVFDVRQFLREVEPSLLPCALPHSWQVTSDSIAARLAQVLSADELVLLKSRPCPDNGCNIAALADLGLVDAHFPRIASDLRQLTVCQLPLGF